MTGERGKYSITRDEPYPRVYNLLLLAESAGLALSEDQKTLLDEVTAFNIRARYPDYKGRFARTATRDFAEFYLSRIQEFREWLLHELAGQSENP